ncbi:hypothetical protein IC007_0868 [Sulfuracidifex tepidarius]|uniref:Uncharacterized protein n=1 Tax=Sulfuracidifex tepidarius TaxID=1294262 RepID=A0A510E2Q3_9CREN|nr:hypothetical protein IC007_0868 [Sulfuracidifex tepidarius]
MYVKISLDLGCKSWVSTLGTGGTYACGEEPSVTLFHTVHQRTVPLDGTSAVGEGGSRFL